MRTDLTVLVCVAHVRIISSPPRLFQTQLALASGTGEDSKFFMRTGAQEAGLVLRNAKKIIDYLQELIAENLYSTGEQLHELVQDAVDAAGAAEYVVLPCLVFLDSSSTSPRRKSFTMEWGGRVKSHTRMCI